MSGSAPVGGREDAGPDEEGDPLSIELSYGRMVSAIDGYYRTGASRLIGQLARRTGCRDEARDVIHEAVARFLKRGPALNAEVKRIDAFVAEASHNIATDRGRSRTRFAAVEDGLRAELPEQHDQVVFLETRDTLRRLEQAILTLKPRTREIFMAHRLDGLTYSEIAERTGLTVKGVEKQMGKAIAKLSRFLDRA